MIEKNESISPFDAFNTFINVLTGAGPILLPPVIAAAGIVQGVLWVFILCCLSQMTAEFVIETLSILNSIKEKQYTDEILERQPLAIQNYNSFSSEEGFRQLFNDPSETFALRETLQYGTMGGILWGQKGQIITATIIIVYLYGVMISKGIIAGQSLSVLFRDVAMLNQPVFWVVLFYLISGSLSFRNVAAISIVSTSIALVRYLTILLMLVSAFIIINNHGTQPILLWDFKEFPNLFSTVMFAYLMHHSIPNMFRPVKPSSSIKYILNFGFVLAGIIFALIPFTGMLAFPNLNQYCFYNTVFDQNPIRFAYYIISFYIFLNIAALPVMTITLRYQIKLISTRTNMMQMCVPELIPSDSFTINGATMGFTLLIVLPCMLFATLLVNQIKFVLGIVGGVCGVIIMMVLPSMMVLEARKKSPTNPVLNPNRSIYFHPFFAWMSIVLAVVFLPYNLYLQIYQLILQLDGTNEGCENQFIPTQAY